MSRTGRPDREGSWESAPPSQVRATLEYPAASGERAADPREPCRGRGTGSVLGVHTEPAWLKFPPLCPSSRSRDLNTPWRRCRPLWSGYAFRVGKSGRNLPHAENISSMAVADRDACEPFSPPSPKLTHADGDSIIADLLAEMSSTGRIFATPPLGNHPTPCSGSVHFRLGASCFSCLKTFQGD